MESDLGQDATTTKTIGLQVHSSSGPGVMHQLTGVIAAHQGNIISVMIIGERETTDRVYFEIEMPGPATGLIESLKQLPVVRDASTIDSLEKIYGKRIIIIGG